MMKKILFLFAIIGVLSLSSCSEELNTDPTNQVSGTMIFADAQNSLTALNGIYRVLYTGGWGSAWSDENGGLPAYILVFDIMGEDYFTDILSSFYI